MVLDISYFRKDKEGNSKVEIVRESQRRRFSKEEGKEVDNVIELDQKWREQSFQTNQLKKSKNAISARFLAAKKAGESTDAIAKDAKEIDEKIADSVAKEAELIAQRDAILNEIGNIVHETVPFFKDEANNAIVRKWGVCRVNEEGKPKLMNHIKAFERIDGTDCIRGTKVAGSRGYYLKNAGALLNMALIQYGMQFLVKKGYTLMQTPFFMLSDIMKGCAQLADYDEQLYKVIGEGPDKYLIATSEQTLCAYYKDEVLDDKQLPIRFAGYSTCFRKEAGRHGADTLGIYRIHQFEKIEQMCITRPDESWEVFESMISTAEDFYQSLGIPYRVINIVSGALNNAAAKKYDLEAWFPGSGEYRELVSCSNCLDYQSRSLNIKYTNKKGVREHVHMLNSTLTATERTCCCIMENFQCEEGIRVPEPLRPYIGMDIIPFVN